MLLSPWRRVWWAIGIAAVFAAACSGGPADPAVSPPPGEPPPTTTKPPVLTAAPEVGDDELQELLDGWAGTHDVVGAVVLTIDGENATTVATTGWSDRETETPMQSSQWFRIGSVTKIYTAALLLDIAEDGLVGLDASVSEWIPEFPTAVTVAHLLSHTSGLRDVDVAAGIFEAIENGETVTPPDDPVVEALSVGLNFEPGTGQRYSSIGYLALERVIESVTGMTYADALRDRILDPLRLRATELETEASPIATPYERLGPASPAISLASLPTSGFAQGAGAAGALVANARDVADFVRALFAGQVVTSDSLAAMMEVSPPRRDYGLGLSTYRVAGRTVYGHNGRTVGFVSSVRHDPVANTTVVVLANDGGAPTDDLADELIASG